MNLHAFKSLKTIKIVWTKLCLQTWNRKNKTKQKLGIGKLIKYDMKPKIHKEIF